MKKYNLSKWQHSFCYLFGAILIFVSSVNAQKSSIEFLYDKIEDFTTVWTPPMKVRCGYDYEVMLSPMFQFKGSSKSPREFVNYGISIDIWKEVGEKLLDRYEKIPFLADDNRFSQDIRKYKFEKNHESAYILLTKEQFSYIANSAKTEMKLGSCQTSFNNKQIGQIKQLLEKSNELYPTK